MNWFANRMKDQPQDVYPLGREHYRDLRRKHVARLIMTYLAPLVILTIYLYVQYSAILSEGQLLHLKAITESQANTLDLFLTERLVNLSNLIDNPRLPWPPTSEVLETELGGLKKNSDAFVDLGYFNASGIQAAYAGPYPALVQKVYRSEAWFSALQRRTTNFIITDIYLGFRNLPHFTIAVKRTIGGEFVALRATLAPEEMYEIISSFEGAHEVYISIVNKDGFYQLVTPRLGTPLESSSFVPPDTPRLAAGEVDIGGHRVTYAYSWLTQANWALIVQQAPGTSQGVLSGLRLRILGVAAILILLSLGIIIFRAGRLVELQIETDRTRIQLVQAAKLASVGELAAGIAHEINNPLAAIAEEAGLVKDLLNPEFGEPVKTEELSPYLDSIQELVLRCRDITHKLLRFVRKTDVELKYENVHHLIDEVVDDLLAHEMMISNIQIVRHYDQGVPQIMTDGHQLQQVLVNILNNGVDAIGGVPGRITISTTSSDGNVRIAISDTGKGMSLAELDKIFLPFYTTKEVGEGTGLGLSVSYGIVKSLGGEIEVDSRLGAGATFTIVLPLPRGSGFVTAQVDS